MASKTVYASSYNYDRSIRWNTTSWAKVTQDSDSAAYNGGWASRVGGGFGTTTRQWVTWIPFPTKTSFLDSSKWEITAATFYLYQGYAGVSNLNNIPGCMTTLRVRGGTLTPSGTNAFTHTAGTGTTTTHLASASDVGYKQYSFSLLDTAKALQSGSATGIYVDLQDSYNTTFYSRLYSNYNSSGRAYNTTQSPRFVITYQGKQFKITYNANGGSGAPSATTYRYATSGSTNLSSTKPTRTGYTFLGWSQSSTATSASYSAGQAWSLTNNANYTLYAVWKINTWTVSYNANGGSGAPSAQTKTYGVTLTLSSTKPTRTGYTFQGWSTSSTATSATYSAGGSYTANAAATLYAVWSVNQAYIAYNSNGGSVSVSGYGYNDYGWITQNGNVYFHNVPYGTSDDPYNATTFGLTKTGYDFDGKWYLYNAAEGITSTGLNQDTAYSSTTYYSQSNKNTTSANTTVYCYLYAGWTPKTIKLTLNANGGSGGTSAVWYKYGTSTFYSDSGCTTAITKITAPTRTGYTYNYYYGDGSSGGGAD